LSAGGLAVRGRPAVPTFFSGMTAALPRRL
jgi:hypothetical protein